MSEMAQAMKLLGRLPLNAVIQYPTGTWGFAGRIDLRLLWQTADGGYPAESDLKEVAKAASHGGAFGDWKAKQIGLVRRVFRTKEEAEKAVADLPA